ncbi:MAG: KOW motif-containing protein [Gemmataceae bacterium]|nr:KOW motif-containing protein [Gemmataceae bacterium]
MVNSGGQELVELVRAVERWAALRTAARWEKSLAQALEQAGVPVFLPLLTRWTSSQGRRRESLVPLFSGYLFVSEPDFLGNPRVLAATRRKVAQVLRPPDPRRLHAELLDLARLLSERQLVQERLVAQVGDVVRILGGPLQGFLGRVVRLKPNRWALVLEISFLGLRLEAEVDERWVEKVD